MRGTIAPPSHHHRYITRRQFRQTYLKFVGASPNRPLRAGAVAVLSVSSTLPLSPVPIIHIHLPFNLSLFHPSIHLPFHLYLPPPPPLNLFLSSTLPPPPPIHLHLLHPTTLPPFQLHLSTLPPPPPSTSTSSIHPPFHLSPIYPSTLSTSTSSTLHLLHPSPSTSTSSHPSHRPSTRSTHHAPPPPPIHLLPIHPEAANWSDETHETRRYIPLVSCHTTARPLLPPPPTTSLPSSPLRNDLFSPPLRLSLSPLPSTTTPLYDEPPLLPLYDDPPPPLLPSQRTSQIPSLTTSFFSPPPSPLRRLPSPLSPSTTTSPFPLSSSFVKISFRSKPFHATTFPSYFPSLLLFFPSSPLLLFFSLLFPILLQHPTPLPPLHPSTLQSPHLQHLPSPSSNIPPPSLPLQHSPILLPYPIPQYPLPFSPLSLPSNPPLPPLPPNITTQPLSLI
ncbi:hypothetical protein C7M84_012514 [Penaeus vannamei]|uniref:Uncharacterized protein n=1 Tax=Penaeus vannamei TaxID=6689 RepID=A0A423SYT1_PENVA|nr:hypothetical protein C7M84_012514 [Penaeus vannamei]